MILKKIQKYLKLKININSIQIYNDSMLHNHLNNSLTLKNSFTHLKIIIVSDDFINYRSIDRHRMVFAILKENIKKKIYSITLYTYTLTEWKHKKNKKINSSRCLKK